MGIDKPGLTVRISDYSVPSYTEIAPIPYPAPALIQVAFRPTVPRSGRWIARRRPPG